MGNIYNKMTAVYAALASSLAGKASMLALAAKFNESKPYAKDDLVVHEREGYGEKLYICVEGHPAGAFDMDHFNEVTVGEAMDIIMANGLAPKADRSDLGFDGEYVSVGDQGTIQLKDRTTTVARVSNGVSNIDFVLPSVSNDGSSPFKVVETCLVIDNTENLNNPVVALDGENILFLDEDSNMFLSSWTTIAGKVACLRASFSGAIGGRMIWSGRFSSASIE